MFMLDILIKIYSNAEEYNNNYKRLSINNSS